MCETYSSLFPKSLKACFQSKVPRIRKLSLKIDVTAYVFMLRIGSKKNIERPQNF